MLLLGWRRALQTWPDEWERSCLTSYRLSSLEYCSTPGRWKTFANETERTQRTMQMTSEFFSLLRRKFLQNISYVSPWDLQWCFLMMLGRSATVWLSYSTRRFKLKTVLHFDFCDHCFCHVLNCQTKANWQSSCKRSVNTYSVIQQYHKAALHCTLNANHHGLCLSFGKLKSSE